MNYNPSNQDLELQSQFEKLKNKKITIRKEQNRDIDETTMVLNQATFNKRQPTIDGYVAPFVLQLQGQGSVMTDHNQSESLPYLSFEIPLDQEHQARVGEGEITIDTEDQTYIITEKN